MDDAQTSAVDAAVVYLKGIDLPFYTALAEVASLHSRKTRDYGVASDPFANLRASKEFSIPPWLGAVLRANDKMARIKSFANKGVLENESVRDSLVDMATYFVIATALYDEENTTVDQFPDGSRVHGVVEAAVADIPDHPVVPGWGTPPPPYAGGA